MKLHNTLMGVAATIAVGASFGCDTTPSPQPPSTQSAASGATNVSATASASSSAASPSASASASSAAKADPNGHAMVLVAAGEFVRGTPKGGGGDDDEHPQRKVTVDAFRIDRLEVTVKQYRGCVEAGACTAPQPVKKQTCNYGRDGADEHPVNCVTWPEASGYCGWIGARLPTEAEWEKAARGSDGRKFPWGNEPLSCERAVYPNPLEPAGMGCGKKETWPVGSKPAGASPYGALDMAGNVWEWVSDFYGEAYYAKAPADNPAGPKVGAHRAIRGGGWEIHDLGHLRTANRFRFAPSYRFHGVGFRCAKSADDALSPKASCTPWAPSPASLMARSSAGRGDNFRELRYDFGNGTVEVHDSDPFATGKEEAKPRVLKDSYTVAGGDRTKLEEALLAVCPDEQAMKRRCAPGGCSRLVVRQADGSETVVEHNIAVRAVMRPLQAFFPKLRTQ